ncbi:MAG: zinc dependent phospholipase C family protein [Bryobacteraceae bacterium]
MGIRFAFRSRFHFHPRLNGPWARMAVGVMLSASLSSGYTVLTHEAIIDSVWESSLKKLLLKRFPNSTPEQLLEAHAYAYGGCIIQDMGYYPFSSRFFSDLTHYVRSGDFIVSLIREAKDLNEFAFAVGALEHYAADTEGHRIATNRAVPLLYPKLRQKFGRDVTYWDDPTAHVRTEFGFDVLQVAAGHYAPEGYHDFIGFHVSKELLERAFENTYGVEMKDVFTSISLAIGSYRYSVSSIIPSMTRVAWSLKKDELQKHTPGITSRKFRYNLSRASFEKEWGNDYHRPGLCTRLMAFFFRLLPATGPFSALKIPTPTPEVEKMFMASFNATVDRYKILLASVAADNLTLPNVNFDAGGPTVSGKYKGTDEAFAKLLDKHADHKFEAMTPELRLNILAYYKNFGADPTKSAKAKVTKESVAARAKLASQIAQLQAASATTP